MISVIYPRQLCTMSWNFSPVWHKYNHVILFVNVPDSHAQYASNCEWRSFIQQFQGTDIHILRESQCIVIIPLCKKNI